MFKQILLASLMIVSLAAFVHAQGPDLSLSAADATPSVPAATPDMVLPQTVISEKAVVQDMVQDVIVEGDVAGDCGCQSSAACTHCGSSCQRPTLKEKCAYYRSVRQSFDRGPCCADYFGGFGPLWETYCADKQRCGTASCAPTATCQSCAVRPRLMLRQRHVRSQCDTCDANDAACDCLSPGQAMPSETQFEIGQPPQPAEPTEADAPAPAASQPEPPAAASHKAASARPGWLSRTVGWRSH